MKTVAIIAEYNPFHNGHKYQIKKVREILGEDTRIIAIMSGNYTQRGEVAVCDKCIRAKAAVLCGVNLVLELPFPYSMSSAEFFAQSAISIINKLGEIDYLAFGVECNDRDALVKYAEECSGIEFENKVLELSSSSEFKELGYPKIFAKAYEEIYKKNPDFDVSMPNNILAIEYLKALKRTDSKVCPLPINRVGAGYNDGFIKNETLQSASAIRSLIKEFGISAFDFVPNIAKDVFTDALEKGQMPADGEKLSTAVISQFRLNPPVGKDDIHDAAGGLYNRLYNNSFETNSISSLTLMTETKRYTRARIRRAIFNSYFGVTSSEIRNAPAFTQVLALDSVGRSILKGIPKSADFSVITKPAEKKDLSSLALKQRERSLKADSVYRLCFETFVSGNESLKTSPFVKK